MAESAAPFFSFGKLSLEEVLHAIERLQHKTPSCVWTIKAINIERTLRVVTFYGTNRKVCFKTFMGEMEPCTLYIVLLTDLFLQTGHYVWLGRCQARRFCFDPLGCWHSPFRTDLSHTTTPVNLNTNAWQIDGHNCGLFCIIWLHANLLDPQFLSGIAVSLEPGNVHFLSWNKNFRQNDFMAVLYSATQSVGEEFHSANYSHVMDSFYSFTRTLSI